MRAFLLIILATTAIAEAQDSLSIGAGSAPSGGVAQVPVYLRDISGTSLGSDAGAGNRIQVIGFKVTYAPSSAVTSISFARAGVIASLTPLYENTIPSAAALGYFVSFAESSNTIPLTLNASAPGDQIGTLLVTFSAQATAGTEVALLINSTIAGLSNQAGTTGETVSNGKLSLVSGTATVSGATTTTALSSSGSPSLVGQSVTFTATVSSATPGTITGTVTFKDGSTTLGSPSVIGGSASYSTSTLTEGSHSITAMYGGDTIYLPSTSAPLMQVVNLAPFGAPSGLTATAITPSQVSVTWLPVAGAATYEVFRSSNNPSYASIATPAGTSISDANVTGSTTYLYKVRAIGSSTSDFSNVDAATTMAFVDDPLSVSSTTVKAIHVTDLRSAVNAFRAAGGLAPFNFSDASLAGVAIRAIHIEQLRSALAAARSTIGLPAVSFTDAALNVGSSVVRATHVQELRNAVK